MAALSAVAALACAGTVGAPPAQALTSLAAAPGPTALLTPAGVDFGSLQLGETSAPVAVTLTNTGAGNLTFWRFGIASSSVNAADYAVLAGGTCTLTLTLASGESCTTLVRFRPTGTGPRSGLLSFWVNTVAGRINTTLTGSVADECADGCF